ncbi:UNVERIFIED_CONTAM: transmembrane protein [Trichonephila clavipes]
MKFRQRLAWLLLFLYLFLSLVVVYYCFELSDQYSALALEHTKLHHSPSSLNGDESSRMIFLWKHLPDVPFFFWLALFAVPYLQIFFCLYICTKPEPKEMLCFIPFFFCVKRPLQKEKQYIAFVQSC